MTNDLGVALLLFVTAAFVLGYLAYLVFGLNKRPADLQGRSSRLVLDSLQNYWYLVTEPMVRVFVKYNVNPNVITLWGVLINVIAAFFVARSWWGLAGWVIVLGAVFDILDGRVARATGRVTRQGRYLDSVTDRFSEGAIMIGFVYAFRDQWMLLWVLLCFISSYLVSFTRAKAEADGVKSCEVGVFQRSERMFVLCVALIFSPIISHYAGLQDQYLLYVALIALTTGNLYTTGVRILHSVRELGN